MSKMVSLGQRKFKSWEEMYTFIDNIKELPDESKSKIKKVLHGNDRLYLNDQEFDYVCALYTMINKGMRNR